jgi:type II secretory pathway component PulF
MPFSLDGTSKAPPKNKVAPASPHSEEVTLPDKLRSFFDRPKEKEIVTFLRELAILVEARVPLMRALNSIKGQNYSTGIRSMVADIQKNIEEGDSLSDGFARYPHSFSNLYVNVTRAGEASGRLEKVLNYLADNREKRYELRRKIIGSLVYPGVILLSFVGVFVFLMVFVMPTLTKTLLGAGVKLPWTTKLIISISDLFTQHGVIILVLVICLALGAIYYSQTKEGKRQWDIIELRIPIFGTLLQDMYMNRFADNLGLLIRESVPITKSLEITGGIMNNHLYKEVLDNCVSEVQKGRMISRALDNSRYFPGVVTQILRVGEESGKTGETLEKIAEYYEKEVENMTSNMTALIEPVLILMLGVGTAIIVASVIMPIYNMAGSM